MYMHGVNLFFKLQLCAKSTTVIFYFQMQELEHRTQESERRAHIAEEKVGSVYMQSVVLKVFSSFVAETSQNTNYVLKRVNFNLKEIKFMSSDTAKLLANAS